MRSPMWPSHTGIQTKTAHNGINSKESIEKLINKLKEKGVLDQSLKC